MSEWAARQCNGKRRYDSERKAERFAKDTKIRTGVAMNAYECSICKHWHVGATEPQGYKHLPRQGRYAGNMGGDVVAG